MHSTSRRYLILYEDGELDKRIDALENIFTHCTLCPWRCNVDRTRGEKGVCQAGNTLTVAKIIPHFGEEPVLTGDHGSGTIFFTYCNLNCQFCQNYQISQHHLGYPMTPEDLAFAMLWLQEKGCANINLVSPTHFLPLILKALKRAISKGLILPLVYNSNGYENVDTLKLLDGIIDIYLPDAKYGDDQRAIELSGAPNYVYHNLSTLKEMYRQVGILRLNQSGIAEQGIIIRHLVLPHNLSGTEQVLKMLKEHLGTAVHLSLMGQYFPTNRAYEREQLRRKLTPEEYQKCIDLLIHFGFEEGWCQEPAEVKEEFIPDFTKQATWN